MQRSCHTGRYAAEAGQEAGPVGSMPGGNWRPGPDPRPDRGGTIPPLYAPSMLRYEGISVDRSVEPLKVTERIADP